MEQWGIELELGVLLVVQMVGSTVFAVFEIETARWRLVLRWAIVAAGTLGLYTWVGHWSLLFPLLMAAMGTTVHFLWCKKNGVHPLHATPRKRYYELRGWEQRE